MKSFVWLALALFITATACSVTPTTGSRTTVPVEDKPYPFTFCVVSGEKLDPNHEPYIIRHGGQIYRFCCRDCYDQFMEDPAPHVQKFNDLLKLRDQ